MRRLLIITLIAALASVTSGCETFGNGKLDKGEIWMIAGAIVVAGVIAAEEADKPNRPPASGQCFRPCPGRCVQPVLC